ncbi:MAG: UDP binding domain-containing protein, partial [Flavobacteriales bacterium]|nr:UDP binding domain-containing protein [Flavobacteriales bacterium]
NKKHSIKNKRILVMGMTFKENCPDLRNSKSLRLVEKLRKEGVDVFVCDPHVTTEDASKKNISLVDINSLPQCDAILFLVAHEKFKCIEPSYFIQKISKDGLLLDLKGIFKDSDLNNSRVNLWRP